MSLANNILVECTLIKGFKQSLQLCLCWGVRLVVRTYQFWQLPGQGGWHWTMSVVGHSLHQFSATLLVSCCSFACRTDNISQHSIMLQKTPQKTQRWPEIVYKFIYFSCDDRSKPVPSTSSELVDNRLPIRDGKQTNKQTICEYQQKFEI